ncbi:MULTISPECIES: galactitol-1-phosphate 5-dehydrogenase [Shouchella]|uniref:Galactitol-1-phosphate 5-dehydrogenase n=1 Tax=Shouchella hunanensis TaxID=766894 RepID=A0ABY7W3E0_9BACI|nr:MULTISPECIES: galactitol-1-phosphate 5-dehydrogenase [Shouchella]WDF02412.1 galactitol-1-phosphate 5-dehydrogenase [Shouchella hunanensis]
MESLKLYGVQDIRYEEAPVPTLVHNDDVRIKISTVGICGSDLSRYKKLGPYVPGTIFGHECTGVIVETGSSVSHLQEGMRVAVCPTFQCGTCHYCQIGEPSRCSSLHVVGAKQDGAFAEYIVLPSTQVLPLPDEVDDETAALIEPSAVVAHGFYRTKIQPGATVAIMGCGSIGLLAIQWAKIFGARQIFAIDIDDEKLEIAQHMGADVLVNSKEQSAHEQIRELTDGLGVDVAIESAGSPITSAQVLALPKKGGEVVYLGIPYGDVPIERFYFEQIVRNELSVHGSWNALSAPFPGREWQATIHYMKTGAINGAPMISHRLPLNQGPDVFKRMTSGEKGFVKVLFYPQGKERSV